MSEIPVALVRVDLEDARGEISITVRIPRSHELAARSLVLAPHRLALVVLENDHPIPAPVERGKAP